LGAVSRLLIKSLWDPAYILVEWSGYESILVDCIFTIVKLIRTIAQGGESLNSKASSFRAQ
jgi:hypothetical protein